VKSGLNDERARSEGFKYGEWNNRDPGMHWGATKPGLVWNGPANSLMDMDLLRIIPVF
jgi:hypothetical protein